MRVKSDSTDAYMVVVDIIIVLAAVVCLVLGFRKGLISQLCSLIAIVMGVLACQAFGDDATRLVGACTGVDTAARGTQSYYAVVVVAHVGLFLLVWLGVWLVSHIISATFRVAHLSEINRWLGAPFMSFKCLLIISILLNVWRVIVPQSTLFEQTGWVVDRTAALAPWLLGVWRDNFPGL